MPALRTLLYVPASRPDMLGKIPAIDADAFVVDLEDGVAAGAKDAGRRHASEAVRAGILHPGRAWMLRINGPGTPWHDDDVRLAESLRPPTVLIPKAESPEVVSALAARFEIHRAGSALMIETPAGVSAARALAGCHRRIEVLVVGSADLRRALGAREDPERSWERHALAEVLLAARLHGARAIDGVFFRFRDQEGLRRHAGVARDLGYDGKSCIHPGQLATVREVFSSGAEEIAWAERVLAAWRARGGAERGILDVDGEMIEALHVGVAERILERR